LASAKLIDPPESKQVVDTATLPVPFWMFRAPPVIVKPPAKAVAAVVETVPPATTNALTNVLLLGIDSKPVPLTAVAAFTTYGDDPPSNSDPADTVKLTPADKFSVELERATPPFTMRLPLEPDTDALVAKKKLPFVKLSTADEVVRAIPLATAEMLPPPTRFRLDDNDMLPPVSDNIDSIVIEARTIIEPPLSRTEAPTEAGA